MKKTFTILFIAFSTVLLLTSFGGSENSDYPSGSPAGYTGSPGDGQDCTACHGGSATTASGIISSNVPSTGYVPGSIYTITVTLTGSGAKGFEVSPQDLTGNLIGSLTAGTNNQLVGAKYITQSNAVTTSPAVWNFTWTAPVDGTGNVTFYGAFTISKEVTRLSTLVINQSTIGVGGIKTGNQIFVGPNPSTGNFYVELSGNETENSMISISDIMGKTVQNEIPIPNGKTNFNLTGSPKGLYFIRITSGNHSKITKLLVK